MKDKDPSHEELGRRSAIRDINAGFPRWAVIGNEAPGVEIHPANGLPIRRYAGDPEPIAAFVGGYNAEITNALGHGVIGVDFRPFLRSIRETHAMFKRRPAQVLAPKRPVLLKGGDIRYEAFVPRPPRTIPKFRSSSGPFVRRIGPEGTFYLTPYDAPVPFVVEHDETIIALRFTAIIMVFHVDTGACLQTIDAGG